MKHKIFTAIGAIVALVGLVLKLTDHANILILIIGSVILLYNGFKLLAETREKAAQVKREQESQAEKEQQEAVHRAFLDKKYSEFNNSLNSISRVNIDLADPTPTKKKNKSDIPDFHFYNITAKTNLDKIFPLAVVDVETTGLNCKKDNIIEISAIKYDVGFVPVSCFSTLINPGTDLDLDITCLTGITNEMIVNSPEISQVVQSFSNYIAGCNIAGHNLPFDLSFLFVNGVQLNEKVRYYDTLTIAKRTLEKGKTSYNSDEFDEDYFLKYDVDDYKLDTLCSYYGIYRDNAHRSLSDCFATGIAFKHLIKDKISK